MRIMGSFIRRQSKILNVDAKARFIKDNLKKKQPKTNILKASENPILMLNVIVLLIILPLPIMNSGVRRCWISI